MDDGFWVLLALAGIVFVFLGPIGFFLTIGARGRLQIAERKILALEAQMRVAQGLPAAAPGTQTGEAPSAQPAQTEVIKPEREREAAWANDSIGEAENPPSREQQTEPVEPPPLLAQRPRRSLEEAMALSIKSWSSAAHHKHDEGDRALAHLTTMRQHVLRVAERADAELPKDRCSFMDGGPADWQALPIPGRTHRGRPR